MNPENYIRRICPRHGRKGRRAQVGFRCCCVELKNAWLRGWSDALAYTAANPGTEKKEGA